MKFVKTDSPEPVAEHVARVISEHLEPDKHLLWLVSGGSSMDVAVLVRQKLDGANLLDHLLVMQVDERYGLVGHKNSNWQQLLDKGFNKEGVTCSPILQGEDLAQTTQEYSKALSSAYEHAPSLSIGLFGIGADGHTAGILPGSPAVGNSKLVESYEASDFTRVTITPAAIAKLDLVIAYAVGEKKAEALKNLQEDLPVSRQPAQALKLAKESYVYNDQVGESL